MLRPSRHTLAYSAAEAARAAGDQQAAERYLEQSAAILPDFGDVRQRWAVSDRMRTGCPGLLARRSGR